MNWLARLKKLESAPADDLQKLQKGVSVVFVGACPETIQNSMGDSATPPPYPDPANDATESADICTARLALFTDRGLTVDDAQVVARTLAIRDAQQDERRLCLECAHLSGGIDCRRCSQWKKLGIGSPAVPADLVMILQRCAGFNHRLEMTL